MIFYNLAVVIAILNGVDGLVIKTEALRKVDDEWIEVAVRTLHDADKETKITLNWGMAGNKPGCDKGKLFCKDVDPSSDNTYKILEKLYSKFRPKLGLPEDVRDNDKVSLINQFLDIVANSNVGQHLLQLLRKNVLSTTEGLKELLGKIWFTVYSRTNAGVQDSSAFEHIFIGEVGAKTTAVSGLHSWHRLYYLEKHDDFKFEKLSHKIGNLFGTMNFRAINNSHKVDGSYLFGRSPEFDMCLATLCFLARPSHAETDPLCKFSFPGGHHFKMVSREQLGHPGVLSSAFTIL